MAKIILEPEQLESLKRDQVATLRVYVSAAAKRAVVVKEGIKYKTVPKNPKLYDGPALPTPTSKRINGQDTPKMWVWKPKHSWSNYNVDSRWDSPYNL